MAVRQEERRNPDTGAKWKIWTVDITFKHPDGRRQRIRVDSPVNTRRGAEDYERDVRNALLDGTYGRKETPTLAVFSEDFIKRHAEASNKPSEIAKKRQILKKHLLPMLGALRLDAIGTVAIDEYVAAKIRDGYKKKTLNNHLAVLRKLLGKAVEWNQLPVAPRIPGLKVAAHDFDWLDFADADKLLTAQGPWRTMALFAMRTGLRLGELRALHWSSIDLEGKRVAVKVAAWTSIIGTPKSGKRREVPLTNDAVAALREMPSRFRNGLVFCDNKGELLSEAACGWGLDKMCEQAGIRQIGWHVLRHTFGSHLATRGVAIRTICALMGHSDIRVTMRYAHLGELVGSDAVAILEHRPVNVPSMEVLAQ